MKKWTEWTRQERVMALLIILLLAAIATRWGYIRREAGSSVQRYFEQDTTRKLDPYDERRIPASKRQPQR